MAWVRKWAVEGSNNKIWTVAINEYGEYGCSCPVWKFKRQECKHIRKIKEQPLITQPVIPIPNNSSKTHSIKIPNIIQVVNRKFNFDD